MRTSRDDMPLAPVRERSVLPAGLELCLKIAGVVIAAVYGGGALSGFLAGHGLVRPGTQFTEVLTGLWQHPGDPAAAWPAEPRPGPAWLTWLCVLLVAIATIAAIEIARNEFDARRRHRAAGSGLATKADLLRAGLDRRSAINKAVKEFPNLAATAELPLTSRLRTRWSRS